MENLRVPTLDEMRADRMTVSIYYERNGDQVFSDSTLTAAEASQEYTLGDRRMYMEDELIAAQVSEGELIARAKDFQISELMAQTERLKKRLAELNGPDGPHAQCARLREELAEASKRGDRLTRELYEAKSNAQTFLAQAYSENDKKARLTRELADLQTKLDESRELVKFKERVADEIDQEADRLRGKVRELSGVRADQLSRIETAVNALFRDQTNAALNRVYETVGPKVMKETIEAARAALIVFQGSSQDQSGTTSQA